MNKMMKTLCAAALLVLLSSVASAKLPAPSDEAKAKAAEAAAKAAWTGKVGAYKLCKAQDAAVAHYMKTSGKGAAPASACADPGAFSYAPAVDAKPLEVSGAHSQPAMATSPPGSKTPAAGIAPAKKP